MKKIPKVIHYCWFGEKPLPEEYKNYIESWKKYMPDYQIIEWNEKNFDIRKCEFIKSAYEHKKWAFVSDYARLDIIYNNGGIYLDTDVEVIKNFDKLLSYECFMGFEVSGFINTGLGFGAVKHHPIIKENLDYYNNLRFINDDGTFNTITCPKITTEILKNKGLKISKKLQFINGVAIFPTEYFCPLNYYNGKLQITENTYSIHRYSMSWIDDNDKKWHYVMQKFEPIFGVKNSKKFIKVISFPQKFFLKIKNQGLNHTLNYYLIKFKGRRKK